MRKQSVSKAVAQGQYLSDEEWMLVKVVAAFHGKGAIEWTLKTALAEARRELPSIMEKTAKAAGK